jgi:hypothetical protein
MMNSAHLAASPVSETPPTFCMLESMPTCQQHMAYSTMVNCCLCCPAVDRFLPSLDAMADLLLEAPPRDQEQVGCGGGGGVQVMNLNHFLMSKNRLCKKDERG